MIMFISIYGVIAFIVFMLFMFPVFQDWSDYSTTEIRKCALFSAGAGALWPVVVFVLITLALCGAYYSWKDRKDMSDDED